MTPNKHQPSETEQLWKVIKVITNEWFETTFNKTTKNNRECMCEEVTQWFVSKNHRLRCALRGKPWNCWNKIDNSLKKKIRWLWQETKQKNRNEDESESDNKVQLFTYFGWRSTFVCRCCLGRVKEATKVRGSENESEKCETEYDIQTRICRLKWEEVYKRRKNYFYTWQ